MTSAVQGLSMARGRPRAFADPTPHRTVLVGRDAEIGAITAALERALAGVAQLVEVTGEPGIGKSALLAESAVLARQRAVQAVSASALASGPGAFGAAIAERLADLAPAGRRQGAAPARRREGAPVPGSSPVPVQRPGDRRFGAERALLRKVSAPDGLVVLLDDLHHRDDETAALLGDLVARPLRAPLLVVYAYRDRQATSALRGAAVSGPAVVRGGAHPAPAVTRLALAPLNEAQCGTLADRLAGAGASAGAGALSGSRHRTLHRDSRGIPLYLRALASGMNPDHRPAAVREALLADLAPLSAGARRAASAAAVLGAELEPGIVAAVADLPDSIRYTVFDELCRHDLLRPVAGTGRFEFRHPLLADAVYEAAEPGWRLAAHRTALAHLEARHAPAETLAPHLAQVAVPGTAGAAAALAAAAVTVRRDSPRTAVRWLDAAYRLLPSQTSTPDGAENTDDRAGLLLELALTLGAAGRGAEAREAVHAVIPLLRPHLVVQRLRAIRFCAQLERQLAHRDAGPALLRRELESIGSGRSAYGAALMAEIAGNELVDGRLAEARTWATQALAAARRQDVRHVEAAGHGVLAMAQCLAGDMASASAELAQATARLEGLLDSELAAQLDAAVWIGWAELLLGRPWDALRHLDRALAVGVPAGHQLGAAYLLVARVMSLCAVGRLSDAVLAAEDLTDLAEGAAADTLRGLAATVATWVAVWAGEKGRRIAARPRPVAAPADLSVLGWFGIVARGMHAEVLLGRGDPAGCTELLLADGRGLPAADAWTRVRWCELLTRAALADGLTDAATEWAARATAAAGALGVPALNGVALLARAQVQAIAEPAVAVLTAGVAVAEFSGGGMLTDARRAGAVAAAARAACGEVEEARQDLAVLQETFEKGGALRLARDAANLRASLALRSVDAPGGTAALTVRERQVAALVAEGASNREIARRLTVKEKTVEMHVSRVFVKLGVGNRVGVARAFGTLTAAGE